MHKKIIEQDEVERQENMTDQEKENTRRWKQYFAELNFKIPCKKFTRAAAMKKCFWWQYADFYKPTIFSSAKEQLLKQT